MRNFIDVEELIAVVTEAQVADLAALKAHPDCDLVLADLQQDAFDKIYIPYLRWQCEKFNAEVNAEIIMHAVTATVAKIVQATTQVHDPCGMVEQISIARWMCEGAYRLILGTHVDLGDENTQRGTVASVNLKKGGRA